METTINQELTDNITVYLNIKLQCHLKHSTSFHILLYIQSQDNTAGCQIQGYLKEHFFLSPRIEREERKSIFSLVCLVTLNTKYSIPNTEHEKICYFLINLN